MATGRLEIEALERWIEQIEKRIEVLEEQYANHYHHVETAVGGYQTTTNPITIGYRNQE